MPEFELPPAAQHWVIVVLVWVGFGVVAGLLARVLLPTGQRSAPLPTIGLGIVGSALGLGIFSWLYGARPVNPISPLGFLAAAGGAFLMLVLYRVLERARKDEGRDEGRD